MSLYSRTVPTHFSKYISTKNSCFKIKYSYYDFWLRFWYPHSTNSNKKIDRKTYWWCMDGKTTIIGWCMDAKTENPRYDSNCTVIHATGSFWAGNSTLTHSKSHKRSFWVVLSKSGLHQPLAAEPSVWTTWIMLSTQISALSISPSEEYWNKSVTERRSRAISCHTLKK